MWSEKTLVINLGHTKTWNGTNQLLVAQRQPLGFNHQILLVEQLLLSALSVNGPFENWPVDYQGNSGNWDRRTEEEVKTDQFIVALYSFTKAVLGVPWRRWQSHGPSRHTPGWFSSIFNIWKLAIIECCCVLSCSAENRKVPMIAYRLFLVTWKLNPCPTAVNVSSLYLNVSSYFLPAASAVGVALPESFSKTHALVWCNFLSSRELFCNSNSLDARCNIITTTAAAAVYVDIY